MHSFERSLEQLYEEGKNESFKDWLKSYFTTLTDVANHCMKGQFWRLKSVGGVDVRRC